MAHCGNTLLPFPSGRRVIERLENPRAVPVFARLTLLGYRGVDKAAYSDFNIFKKVRDAADELVLRILGEVEKQTRRVPQLKQGEADTRNWELGDPDLIHELRRAALHLQADGKLPDPPPGVMDPTGDVLLRDAYRSETMPKMAHLVRHGESSGIYVPLFFPAPFWLEEPGVSVGSAQGLLLETETLSSAFTGGQADGSLPDAWSEAAQYLAALREAALAATETGLTLELYWEESQRSAGEV